MRTAFKDKLFDNLLHYCETDQQRQCIRNIHEYCSSRLRPCSETRKVIYKDSTSQEIVQVSVRKDRLLLILLRLPAVNRILRITPNQMFRYGFELQADGTIGQSVDRFRSDRLKKVRPYGLGSLQYILLGEQTSSTSEATLMSFVQLALEKAK